MTTSNLTALIDSFADLKARQAALEIEEKNLKAALADVPAGNYESDTYRLSIIDSIRDGADKELAAEIKQAVEAYKATLSRQYLCAHTTHTPVRTHKIGAPTGKDLAQ
jgi:hypothetical protein